MQSNKRQNEDERVARGHETKRLKKVCWLVGGLCDELWIDVLGRVLKGVPFMRPVLRSVCVRFRDWIDLPRLDALRRDARLFDLANLASRTGSVALLDWCEANGTPVLHLKGMRLGISHSGGDAVHLWHWERVKGRVEEMERLLISQGNNLLPQRRVLDFLVAAALKVGKSRIAGVLEPEEFKERVEKCWTQCFDFIKQQPGDEERQALKLSNALSVARSIRLSSGRYKEIVNSVCMGGGSCRAALLDAFRAEFGEGKEAKDLKTMLGRGYVFHSSTAPGMLSWARKERLTHSMDLMVGSGSVLEPGGLARALVLFGRSLDAVRETSKGCPVEYAKRVGIFRLRTLRFALDSPRPEETLDAVHRWFEAEPVSVDDLKRLSSRFYYMDDAGVRIFEKIHPEAFREDGVHLDETTSRHPWNVHSRVCAPSRKGQSDMFFRFYRRPFWAGERRLELDARELFDAWTTNGGSEAPEDVLVALLCLVAERPEGSIPKTDSWAKEAYVRAGLMRGRALHDKLVELMGQEPSNDLFSLAMCRSERVHHFDAVNARFSGAEPFMCGLDFDQLFMQSATDDSEGSFRLLNRRDVFRSKRVTEILSGQVPMNISPQTSGTGKKRWWPSPGKLCHLLKRFVFPSLGAQRGKSLVDLWSQASASQSVLSRDVERRNTVFFLMAAILKNDPGKNFHAFDLVLTGY